MAVFDKFSGIGVASGFKLQAKAPLDGRLVVETIADRDALVTENGAYEGMKVYVKADKNTYTLKGTTVNDWGADGSDTAADLSALEERVHGTESNVHDIQVALDSQIEFTQAEKDKLAGIATGANKTTVDTALSPSSTNPVQNKVVNSALSGKIPTTRKVNNKALSADITLSAADVEAIAATAKGAAGGVAELDSNGKVPSEQLPSYVDDVIEGYVSGGKLYKEAAHTTEITAESGKIYVDLATNKTYRWSGSALVEISASLALGETSSTAYRGDRGKTAYEHSQSAHAPSNAERNVVVGIKKNGTDVAVGSDRKVDITVPTKVSELTNDAGYVDGTGTVAKANQFTTARTIDGVSFNGTANINHYCVCSTVAATAAKTATLSGFTLATGATVKVKFTATNAAANPTLNVNNTGAKAIKYRGAAITAGALAANRIYEFVYNGTDYELIGDLDTNTTYAKATSAKDGLMSKEDKAKLDTMPQIYVSSTAPTTATPNSLWFEI